MDCTPDWWTGPYKKHTATGPDGWSRLDIASMAPTSLNYVAELFTHVQHGGAWPQQLVTGFVCPARKKSEAEAPKDYRPIILLSFLYRLWAMAASRSALSTMAAFASTHTYGFVPSKRTSDLWYVLQCAIEMCGESGKGTAGYNLDLVRCFNCLPREVLLFACGRLGMSQGTIQGWRQALTQLERRFAFGGNVGPPHRSHTGFPEGDPLSCTAMLSLCILMDTYISAFSGTSLLCSYVDNIQLLADTSGELLHGYLTLKVFLQMMDLTEDPHKSYSWATTAQLRSQLRQFGWPIRLAFKDLGAQMAFSKVSRTTTAQDRMEQVANLWPVLKMSQAPKWFKGLAIRTAIWTKVFHAVENRFCSATFCKTLRTRVMNSLGWARAGASPWVRIALMQVYDLDPGFFQVWAVLRMALRMFHLFPWLCEQWGRSTIHASSTGQGPFHSLQQALALLHWTWNPDLSLDIGFVIIPMEHLHLQLLRKLAEMAWDDYVCERLRERRDFQDLFSVDRRLSFARITDSYVHEELLLTVQDGTFYTEHELARFDLQRTGMCTLCHVEDDLHHRCVQCPRYADVRAPHRACVERWSQHGPSFTHHGLVPRNEWWLDWLVHLQRLPTQPSYAFEPEEFREYDIFTDGTCAKCEGFSYAAWAIVVPEENRVLAHGALQGMHQSINRAELVAVINAFRWKLRRPCLIRVWSDSLYVVRNVEFLRQHQMVPEYWTNRDLWLVMLQLVLLVDWSTASITKIPAHLDPSHTTSPLEDWILAGNKSADQAAKRCNRDRGMAFDHLLTNLTRRHRQLERMATSQRQFLLAMSLFDLKHEPPPVDYDDDDIMLSSLGNDAEANDCLIVSILSQPSTDFGGSRFEPQFLADFSEWMSSIDLLGPVKMPISLVELVLGFISCTGRAFPIQMPHDSLPNIVYPSGEALGVLMRPTLQSSSRILRAALEHLFASHGCELPIVQGMRPEVQIFCRVSCLVVGWPGSIFEPVRKLLNEYAAHPIRQPRDLARHYGHLF